MPVLQFCTGNLRFFDATIAVAADGWRFPYWRMTKEQDDLKEFMLVLRNALLMIVRYIERRYGLQPKV